MKNAVIILLTLVLGFGCKKDDDKKEETTASSTPANGTLSFQVNTFDSLGDVEPKTLNTTVYINPSNSAQCDSTGKVSFSLPPGSYAPSILRSKYEGVPFNANVTSNTTTSVTTLVARNSPYVLTISSQNAVNSNSVTLSMNLNKPIPAGKQVKVAVLFSTSPNISVNSYSVVNEYQLPAQNNPNFNVASGNIQTAINALNTNSVFYLLAVPVTYGNYYSAILGKNILIGDNLPTTGVPTATVQLTKTW